MGNIIKPNYVTCSFSNLLKKNTFSRYLCFATVEKWYSYETNPRMVDHSDFATTANIYAHLECGFKSHFCAGNANRNERNISKFRKRSVKRSLHIISVLYNIILWWELNKNNRKPIYDLRCFCGIYRNIV